MRKTLFTFVLCTMVLHGLQAKIMLPFDLNFSERVNLDPDEVEINAQSDSFVVHIGNNMYLETNKIYRDEKGLYTFEMDFNTSVINECAYEKKWKCPYCYNLYPIGQACTKADCPSKYK